MTTTGNGVAADRHWAVPAMLLVGLLLIAFIYREGLAEMARDWEEPEYSYAYLIPFLSLYVLLGRLGDLRGIQLQESLLGVAVLAAGLLAFAVGDLSALYVIVQYGFLLAVWGLVLVAIGPAGIRRIWPALLFLVFLVPLPKFLQFGLSERLQLVSSELGTLMLRLMGVPVFLEGNVIDLGIYKLQVVEACSGLRYLFPLMSFGFLCAVMFRAAAWQRWLIFLSSLPITVVMNSFRIAVTGVLVNRFGTEAAEGFLHYFEGWVIFTACLALMFLEMAVLAKFAGRKLDDVLDLYVPSLQALQGRWLDWSPSMPLRAAMAMLVAGAALSVFLAGRQELIPSHVPLNTFPLVVGDWRGAEGELSEQELAQLRLTDYAVIKYGSPSEPAPVELYVAYYESQRKGTSAHSPRSCLPGSGWRFESFGQTQLADVQPSGAAIPVNRAVISMGETRLVVYYWFMQRGRLVTNEYLVKWYIFWDSLTQRRTDGALVRVITPVSDAGSIDAADARLTAFVRKFYPSLYYHVPQADAVIARNAAD
jgi:exosortase D (VPLPA-CTERM-specific)